VLHTLASLLIYTLVAVFGTSGNHAIDSKNRIWNFFSSPSVFVGKNHSQVVESQQEKTVLTENTASGMPEYRARYYDPVMGRFLSEDPIGFGGGDGNLQRYVLNSPYRFLDPKGKSVLVGYAQLNDFSVKIAIAALIALGTSTAIELAIEAVQIKWSDENIDPNDPNGKGKCWEMHQNVEEWINKSFKGTGKVAAIVREKAHSTNNLLFAACTRNY